MGYIMELRGLVGTRPIIMTGACVILLDCDNRLLLQQRTDNGMWGLPGGSMEPGEEMKEVAGRELFEETGLIAQELELLDIFSGQELYYQYPHGDEVFNVVVAYVCRDYVGVIKGDDMEVQEIRFFNLEEIPNQISPPDIPVIIRFLKEMKPKEDHNQ
ncbi:NUDIX hydrolase [Paenibacillus glacialis]|uniref:ADP-ribose pyrophosphatase n=1 Tax=Paenibacillus glacialis TaxID=494026 RepID=A0A168HPD7_9BACL|nr:NUDIX hydrolase [Paenibacillus glacialis]OAB38390.1 ADP-ribose pyrophosphatase [Paenibacillus glacialis]